VTAFHCIPESTSGESAYSSCEMFARNYSDVNISQFYSWNGSLVTSNQTPVVRCSQWIYDQSTFTSTIVSKVNRKQFFCSP